MSHCLCTVLFLIALAQAGTVACKNRTGSDAGKVLSLESLENEPKDAVRTVSLEADLSDKSKYTDLAILLQEGGIAQSMSGDLSLSASKSEYSSLLKLTSQASGSASSDNMRMRLDTIKINRTLPPSVLKAAGSVFGLQLSLSSNSLIKAFRRFATEAEEKTTPQYSLTDLPVNAGNIKKMRTGDLIVMPIEGQLMTAVDGSFIRKSYTAGRVFVGLTGSSLSGEAQSGIKANLIASGRFEMHILKVSQHQLRVRFFQMNEKSLSLRAGADAFLSTRMSLIPYSKLQQIGEIKKVLNIKISRGEKLRLPETLKRLTGASVLNGTVSSVQRDVGTFEKEAQKRPDGLVELSAKINVTPEYIQQQAISRMNDAVTKVNPLLAARIRKTGESLKEFSDQEIRFDAGITWSESRRGLQQFYADYLFDLRDENAIEACLQAVSGGAMLVSSRADTARYIQAGKPLHNLVLAERMARSQSTKANPSVIRIVGADSRSEISESRLDVRFGRQMSFAVSESWQRDKYQLMRADSPEGLSGHLSRWSFRQGTQFGLVNESRERSSGFMSDVLSQTGEQSVYWYAQEIDSRTAGQPHLNNFYIQAHNVLGPAAASLGLEKFYGAEAGGRFRGRIVLAFAPSLLEKFFDRNLNHEALIWRSAAAVSQSFDNTFGLPFLVFPAGMPSVISGTPSEADCRIIATHWGSFYCHYLANEFITRLRTARATATSESKSQFFETFFPAGFGANKLGSDLLARLLLQWAIEFRKQLSPKEIAIVIEGRHSSASLESLNPQISFGDEQLIGLLEETLPVW